jgi:hypothetical protein
MDTSLIFVVALLGGEAPPPPPPTASICTSAIGDEARTVAYFRGDYGVLGVRAGHPYTGRLTLSGAESSEALEVSGLVDGKPRQGTAKYVRCGPDRVRQLEITLGPEHKLYCVPHLDYDNLSRASCTRSLSDPNGDQELWFQRFAP